MYEIIVLQAVIWGKITEDIRPRVKAAHPAVRAHPYPSGVVLDDRIDVGILKAVLLGVGVKGIAVLIIEAQAASVGPEPHPSPAVQQEGLHFVAGESAVLLVIDLEPAFTRIVYGHAAAMGSDPDISIGVLRYRPDEAIDGQGDIGGKGGMWQKPEEWPAVLDYAHPRAVGACPDASLRIFPDTKNATSIEIVCIRACRQVLCPAGCGIEQDESFAIGADV